jgi:hypothetical protein
MVADLYAEADHLVVHEDWRFSAASRSRFYQPISQFHPFLILPAWPAIPPEPRRSQAVHADSKMLSTEFRRGGGIPAECERAPTLIFVRASDCHTPTEAALAFDADGKTDLLARNSF